MDHNKLAAAIAVFSNALQRRLFLFGDRSDRGDKWQEDNWQADLRHEIRRHVDKGDPLDVAAYCVFAYYHGWTLDDPADMMDGQLIALPRRAESARGTEDQMAQSAGGD